MSTSAPKRIAARDKALLREAAGADAGALVAMERRVRDGEPAAYVAGFFRFRGRRFVIDPRAYVTDPELTHLIDAVEGEARRLELALGRPPRLAEFGTGAASLAITLQLEHPNWTLAGLDIDADALAVARENARLHGVALPLIESDFLDAWPGRLGVPDLIFGDPPWGGATDLYAEDRDARYYERMPAKSAFPPGGNPCAVHDELIARVRARGWPTQLVLNYGVLAPEIVERSTDTWLDREIVHPATGLTIVSGRLVRPP